MSAPAELQVVRFPVRGMTCGSCVSRIVLSVSRVPGVAKVSVDLRRETATVRREPSRAPDGALAAAVAAAGYEADLDSAEELPEGSDRGLLERLLGRR